jgi:sugar phosphate isomerase/epimerase
MENSMNLNRRSFLGHLGAGAATAAAASTRLFAQQRRIDRLGMQLYTVRDAMAKDFESTLARVAELGYKEVEFAGYFNKSPQEVKAALAKSGLTSPSTHVGYDMLADKFQQVIEDSKVIGHSFIVNPWIDDATRNQPGAWKRAADTFNRAGEMANKAGLQFAYHNHHFEFVPVEGQAPLDLILKTCDPSLVKIELDLCWTAAAGQDPVAWFQKHPGRFPMVHVKGLKRIVPGAAKWTTAPPIKELLPDVSGVGPGPIDWKRIFSHAKEAGIEHYFVEHDQPASPFDSLAASAKYLEGLRF